MSVPDTVAMSENISRPSAVTVLPPLFRHPISHLMNRSAPVKSADMPGYSMNVDT